MSTTLADGLVGRASPAEFDELESNVRTYCRTFDTIFTRARGASMFDQEGRRYVDFLSGAGALGYGHNNPRIKEAVIEYLRDDGVLHSLDLHTAAKLEFLRKFRDLILAPRGLDYRVQFCGPTGTDAVEAALKLARKVTGQSTVIAFTNAYHGVSLGSLAATASAHHRASAGLALQSVVRMPFENYLGPEVDTIALMRAMLARGSGLERPAAIIVETVQAEGGINVASVEWLRRLSDLAAAHGILLIVDDIQVGCGRTGTFFSFERAGIKPDIICLSKAIGGIGMPMSLVLVKPELDLWSPGDHVGTFRGNNLAFVAAAAALDYWREPDFEQQLERRSLLMRERLAAVAERYPDQCEGVRGVGMIQGLSWRDPSLTTPITRAAFAHGLIVESCGPNKEVLKLLPPLVIEDEELEEGLSILSHAIGTTLDADG
ncbi:MAG TPA: diaminobutyrate--2-oxoglutarate transaminase [Pyrinomonadaceae bacterium]|nr:diaminobutyrate--2-oxoglutarate transaminase [Pyrinomonadaceae bacterium]